MSKNRDFHSIAFFRSVRDKHAALLSEMCLDAILAFYQSQQEPNNGAASDRADRAPAGRRGSDGQPARVGVR